MHQTVTGHFDPDDKIGFTIYNGTSFRPDEPFVGFEVGDCTFITRDPKVLRRIAEQAEAAIVAYRLAVTIAIRAYVRKQWTEAHPEEAIPLDRGGVCQACEEAVDQLYMVPSDSRGDIDAECCAGCALVPVELAEALSNAVKVGNPDEFGPDEIRQDLHDAGIDTDQPAVAA